MPFEELPAAEPVPIPQAGSADSWRSRRLSGTPQEDLEVHSGPYGPERPGGHRLHGRGHALGRPLGSARELLYDYFKQLFAQVTNPPMDAIREELVTSVKSLIGAGGQPSGPGARELPAPQASRRHPWITTSWPALKGLRDDYLNVAELTLYILVSCGTMAPPGLRPPWRSSSAKPTRRSATAQISLYSPTAVSADSENAPIPSLLAVAGLHQPPGPRADSAPRWDSWWRAGDAREVHALRTAHRLRRGCHQPLPGLSTAWLTCVTRGRSAKEMTREDAIAHYLKASRRASLRPCPRWASPPCRAIAARRSSRRLASPSSSSTSYFTYTASRIGGIGRRGDRGRHPIPPRSRAYPQRGHRPQELDGGGDYQWRRDGEFHLFNPETVFLLQQATRTGQYDTYREYSRLINDQSERMATLRGQFEFKPDRLGIQLDEVEPAESIMKRFVTGRHVLRLDQPAEAHETLAIAMNRIGGKSNTGEGGEDRGAFHPRPQRRFAPQRHQAGGFRPLRRDQRVSGQCR